VVSPYINLVKFSGFHKFLLLYCLRPDRVLNGISSYVSGVFGSNFLKSGLDRSLDDLVNVSEEKVKWCPFLLVNDKGSDSSHEVEKLAAKNGVILTSIPMGSSEGRQQVDAAIAKGLRTGAWVLVKNAHLAIDWLTSLEKNLPSIAFTNKFRLFVTLESHDGIPVNLIRSSRLMVFEPPVGAKQCLMQTLNSVPSRLNDAIPVELGRLIFMLAWLHSIIIERSRYTPIGWTKNYDFNYSDFDMGLVLLVSWVEDNSLGRTNISLDKIPWEAIQNLISRTVYGGKIDRQVDQTLMDTMVKECFCPSIFDPSYCLVSANMGSEGIKSPRGISVHSYIDWSSTLLEEQSPHWLSLPQKANYLLKENQG
jgi:dynein heavy chain 1, cytosolic